MTLHIVGGTYKEFCVDPHWEELYGSGLRAAHALSSRREKVVLHTSIGEEDYESLQCIGEALNVQLHASLTSETIAFEYSHPLSNPRFFENQSLSREIEVVENLVLQYGMVEGNPVIHASKVVFDPQSPTSPISFWHNGSTTDELIWVCNFEEAALFSGSDNLEDIKQYLFETEKVNSAIIKNGAAGAILLREGTKDLLISSFKTERVWPIGTGDIYSACFAYEYLIKHSPIEEAAHSASLSTAYYSNTAVLPIPEKLDSAKFDRFVRADKQKKKIYLAGPFFSMSERWFVEEIRDQLIKIGLDVFSPIHDVGLGEPEIVVPLDLEAINNCDIMIAILHGLDAGTLFEIGYARARNIPVIVFNEGEKLESLTMLVGSGCMIESDFSTLIYRTYWESYYE